MSLDARSFKYVQQLVRERSAIVLEEGKQYLVHSRLSSLARREKLASAQEVIDLLRATPNGPLQRKVIEAMTTTETLFFRDIKPYEVLQRAVIPALVKARATERRIRIWSCASSSGQEPYSLAMLIHEHFPNLATWDVKIIATDISTEMLARTKAGIYSQLEINRGLPIAYLRKYFEQRDLEWQVRADLRTMIETRELNLAAPWAGLPQIDLVMLRNVLIYFDVETKKQILCRVRKAMRPDAAMFLGTAETTMNLDDGFDLVRDNGTTYYQQRSPR
jgi:chemotaxis protein methyltransferase CheR